MAALQIGLRSHGLYAGAVDGVAGPETVRAIRVLQQRAGLQVDGVFGPATRRALGPLGRPAFGSRALRVGARGWDVGRLQFLLASHGFASGPLDGHLGPRTQAALLGFQRAGGLTPDGVAGPHTLRALERPPAPVPFTLSPPVPVAATDGFGPRGERFHTGVDFPAPIGTHVTAGAAGRVAYAGWHNGGWGLLVTIAHGRGLRTMYAHLARIDVRVGQRVGAGTTIGLVGSSGHSTGPHLHFEVRVRGAAIDPHRVLAGGTQRVPASRSPRRRRRARSGGAGARRASRRCMV
ncbi:MAG TPA: peptidoglycan DD-metalloendopeptidase family protein [Gaiellaceae bacterium]|nr:peptidoglycan DD-metalloendopeptidase family protein [Gaiellaceae bacterium]